MITKFPNYNSLQSYTYILAAIFLVKAIEVQWFTNTSWVKKNLKDAELTKITLLLLIEF